MASATKTFTSAELLAICNLAKTETVDFTAAEIPVPEADAMAQAYLDLILAKDTSFPFGRKLQQFANAQVVLIKAAIAAP